MQIEKREVKAVYFKDTGVLYIELLLGEDDCLEKRKFPDVQLCPGDCQGTYLSAVVQQDRLRIIGSIYPKPHVMYNQEFAKKRNLKKEEIGEYTRKHLKNDPSTIRSYMGGRKKQIYVGKEHVQTIFEGCVFRVAQDKQFSSLLMNERQKELEKMCSGYTHRIPLFCILPAHFQGKST